MTLHHYIIFTVSTRPGGLCSLLWMCGYDERSIQQGHWLASCCQMLYPLLPLHHQHSGRAKVLVLLWKCLTLQRFWKVLGTRNLWSMDQDKAGSLGNCMQKLGHSSILLQILKGSNSSYTADDTVSTLLLLSILNTPQLSFATCILTVRKYSCLKNRLTR